MQFSQLGLSEPLLAAAEAVGYSTATPIQAAAIPVLLSGSDLVGCSQTGSGKTAAFALPLLAHLDPARRVPQVLVLTPTRELALQVAQSFQRYGSQLAGLSVAAVYGGAAYGPQLTALRRGVQVVVGTPGRLIDLIKQHAVDLQHVSHLVLDEADEMLRMGFIDDVHWILSRAPARRQVALFSATMPPPIRAIADQYLQAAESVTVQQPAHSKTSIEQRCLVVPAKQKTEMLRRLLEVEPTDGVIVFVKTRLATVALADRLVACGFRAAPLSGDVAQAQRQLTVEKLKSGRVDILVATDVAARGLDVQRISHVINYDLPHDSEAYIHRIGRTGRAGRSGVAILMVSPAQRRAVAALQRATDSRLRWVDPPSVQQINRQRTERFHQRISEALADRQLETLSAVVEQYIAASGESPGRVAAALAVMVQGDQRFFSREIETPQLKQPRITNRSTDRRRARAANGAGYRKNGRSCRPGSR